MGRLIIGFLAGITVTVAGGALAVTAHSAPAPADGRLRYTTTDTGTITRLVVRGTGCFTAEDATTLHLLSWDPSHHRVVYRCVTP